MPKTTADVPPVIAGDYAKLPRSSAVASADGDGYTKTTPMKKAQVKGSNQYGLPRSTGALRKVKMKG